MLLDDDEPWTQEALATSVFFLPRHMWANGQWSKGEQEMLEGRRWQSTRPPHT